VNSGDINISRTSKSRDRQLGEKFKTLAPKNCRLGPILLLSAISCERHAKISGGRRKRVQFSELQKVSDLDLYLGAGQGHISMPNTYWTTSMPDHVIVHSSSTEIRPFEIRVISTFREV